MVEVKTNFRNKYSDLSCPVCKLNEDTQQHVMECTILQSRRKIMVSDITKYSHLFSEEIEKQSLHLKPLNHSGMKEKTTLKQFRQPMSGRNQPGDPVVVTCDLRRISFLFDWNKLSLYY